jgi:hypothetical protein
LTLRRFAGAWGDHYFVIRILNVGLQITRLPMHQWMAAVIDFFALIKGFAIWHARYLRRYDSAFHPLRPRTGVSQCRQARRILRKLVLFGQPNIDQKPRIPSGGRVRTGLLQIHASIIRPHVTQTRVTLITNLMRVHIRILPERCVAGCSREGTASLRAIPEANAIRRCRATVLGVGSRSDATIKSAERSVGLNLQ